MLIYVKYIHIIVQLIPRALPILQNQKSVQLSNNLPSLLSLNSWQLPVCFLSVSLTT